MILGIGTDVVQLTRVEKIWERFGFHFANRLLLGEEFEHFQKSKKRVKKNL